MSLDLKSLAQAALDMASQPGTVQSVTPNYEEESGDTGNGSVPTGSYKSPTVSDEEEDKDDHSPLQHIITGQQDSVSGHNEAGTPPTQAELLEVPTPQAHEIEDSEIPGAVALVDFATTTETPVPLSQDNSVDALFNVYDDYESQLDDSPNQSGTSQAESTDELFVRPSTSHEINTGTNTNGGNSDEQIVALPSSPAVSIASVENRKIETQPELKNKSENTTIQNAETTANPREDLQSSSVASQASIIPSEEAQLGPQVEGVHDENDQAAQKEIKKLNGQADSDATQNGCQEAEKAPIAHMELSFEKDESLPDQDIDQDIEPLTPPDKDQSQTEKIAHQEPSEDSRPESIIESTEVVSQSDSQPSEGYANEEAESQHSPLEIASEPITKQEVTQQTHDDLDLFPKQEVDEEKRAMPEYQSSRLKVESPPRGVKDEESPDSPGPPSQSEVGEKESPVPEDEPQPVDAYPTPEEAAPEQRQEETPNPRARKPLPTGPLLNRPQKTKPVPKAPRKRKLGIYDFFYESDPENWPKKSRIARPQPDDKPKAKKAAAAKTSKKRSRKEREDKDDEPANASHASDDEALAVKKREAKKPRGAQKAAKEPKVAPEKRKRGPTKKKKTEELSKPSVKSDFDNDPEFFVDANTEDHSEGE